MRIASPSVSQCFILGAMFALIGWLTVSPAPMRAQTINSASLGDNAVWLSSTTIAGSSAFIDASVFSGSDICAQINSVLISTGYPPNGAVIDARGISSNLTCASGTTPWVQSGSSTTNPSTILLPAGTITIPKGWVVPDRTRIIGEGRYSGTVIKAGSSVSGAMIQLGSSSTCDPSGSVHICYGVSVEGLVLNHGSVSVDGINNTNSGDLSYLNQLNLPSFGTALKISSASNETQNSGPYSNFVIDHPTTACIEFEQSYTRGIHGLTCIGAGATPSGVLLDSSNGTIEDLHFEQPTDGILAGQNANAEGNVLLNINGSQGGTNVIHICGPKSPANCQSGYGTVADLALLGVASFPTGGYTNTIQDDVTGKTLSDSYLGMYVLGEQVTDGGSSIGYSRFSTSPHTPTWGVGSSGPGTSSCATGALYSNTSGTSGSTDTLYICAGGAWVAFK
jgi:hypothetical protein